MSFTAHNSVYDAEGSFASWKVTKLDIPGGDLTKGTLEIEVDLASVNRAAVSSRSRGSDFAAKSLPANEPCC